MVHTQNHRWELQAPHAEWHFPPTWLGLQNAIRAVNESFGECAAEPVPAQASLFFDPPPVTPTSPERDTFIRLALMDCLQYAAMPVCSQLHDAALEISGFPHKDMPWLFSAPVLFHPYILLDISHYRAAALAASVLERFGELPGLCGDGSPTPQQLAHKMEHWTALYMAPGANVRSVGRTLGLLGEIAPWRDLLELRSMPLQRPIPSNLHLAVLAEVSRAVQKEQNNAWLWDLLPVILRATEEEVRHALNVVMKVLRREDDVADHVPVFIQTVARAGVVRGRTIGLVAKAAVAWLCQRHRLLAPHLVR